MNDSPTVLISGGASGLGLAIGQQAAAHGWRVALADVNETRGSAAVKALLDAGHEAMFIRCDVREEPQVRVAVQRVVRRWGQLDVLVNAAGVASAGLFESLTDADWHWQLDTNLMGTVRACRAAVSEMQRQGRGQLINIAAMEAELPQPALSSFNACQAAISALTEGLQAELTPLGIQVTLVVPGFFRSNLADNLRGADAVMRARFQRFMSDSEITAEEVASSVLAAMQTDTARVEVSSQRRQQWLKRWRPQRYREMMAALASKYRR